MFINDEKVAKIRDGLSMEPTTILRSLAESERDGGYYRDVIG